MSTGDGRRFLPPFTSVYNCPVDMGDWPTVPYQPTPEVPSPFDTPPGPWNQPLGWKCLDCGRVLNPDVKVCPCSEPKTDSTSNTREVLDRGTPVGTRKAGDD